MSNPAEEDYPMEEKYPLNEEEVHENAEKKEETVVVVTQDGPDTNVPCGYIVAIILSILSFFCVPFFGVIAIIFTSLAIEEKRDKNHSDRVRCGHRCKYICGLVTAVLTIVLIIVLVCLGAAFFKIIFDNMESILKAFGDGQMGIGQDESSVNGGSVNGTL